MLSDIHEVDMGHIPLFFVDASNTSSQGLLPFLRCCGYSGSSAKQSGVEFYVEFLLGFYVRLPLLSTLGFGYYFVEASMPLD